MEALEAIRTRRSVRSFTAKPVPREIIEKIIDGARLAPSANNIQPWEFVIVTDQATRERIASVTDYGRFIADAPVCIAVFCEDTKSTWRMDAPRPRTSLSAHARWVYLHAGWQAIRRTMQKR